MFQKIKDFLYKFSQKNIFADYSSFLFLSALIGIIVGFAVVFFHNFVNSLNLLLQDFTNHFHSSYLAIIIVIIPALGMFIQAILIKTFPNSVNSRGVTEIIKSAVDTKYKIPFINTFLNFVASTISLGTSSTLGPEAPAAFLGGGISNKLSFLFNIPEDRKRILTASGAGAAISAIFNTPLAGVFFALEIILLNDFHTTIFSSLIISSITASIVSRTFLGEDPIFSINIVDTIKFTDMYLFIIFGLISGFISFVFHKYSALTKKIFLKLKKQNVSILFSMTFVGFIVGISSLFYPDILGIGYVSINKMLNLELNIYTVIALFILKLILVPIVYNAGAFGGLFAPSLFIGAALGFIFHYFLGNFFGINLDFASVVLIGMGSVLAGIHSIPITAILMIFELTQNYLFILPMMMSVIVSSLVMHIIYKKSIYLTQLDSELNSASYDILNQYLNNIYVKDIDLKSVIVYNENSSIEKVIPEFISHKANYVFLVDNNNKISGVIEDKTILFLVNDFADVKNILVAKDISTPIKYYVKNNFPLIEVFRIMNKYGLNEILITNSAERPIGLLRYSDIQKVIDNEYIKKNLSMKISDEISKLQTNPKTNVFDDYFISELTVPEYLIGKSLLELKFRDEFNLEVILIKKVIKNDKFEKTEVIQADPKYLFHKDDKIIVFGRKDNIEKLENRN